ncbi:MAG: hypothetical protein R3A44_10525 [Caldilineaceae bacterium]
MQLNKLAEILTSIFTDTPAPERSSAQASDQEADIAGVNTVEAAESELCHTDANELAAYVDAELNGQPVATEFPQLHAALDTCETCRTAYLELKHLLQLEQAGELREPSRPGKFDFSYLKSAVSTNGKPSAALFHLTMPILAERTVDDVTWRLTELRRMVVTFSEEFVAALQPKSLQYATLKSAGDELFRVDSADMADDLNVTVSARAKRRDADQYVVSVDAQIPSRGGWPNLAGTNVTLLVDGQAVATRQTDAFGKAVFDAVARNDLGRMEIAVEAT